MLEYCEWWKNNKWLRERSYKNGKILALFQGRDNKNKDLSTYVGDEHLYSELNKVKDKKIAAELQIHHCYDKESKTQKIHLFFHKDINEYKTST